MNRERGYKSYKKRYSSSGQYQEEPVIIKSPEEEQNERIVSLFFKIGDKHQPQDHLEHLADLLEKEYESRDIFIKSWKTCLPVSFNISLYGTLTGILNARNFDIGQDMIAAAAELLNAGLESSSFRQIKLVIRYFAECVNAGVILPGQLIGLFDTFLAVASEINVNQERADAFVYVVIAAIPWAAGQLRDRNLMELERIMGEIAGFMSTRADNATSTGIKLANNALLVYRDCADGEPYEAVDKLTLLWEQTVNLKNSNWETPILPKYNDRFSEANSRQIPHDIPAITIPSSVTQVKFLYQTKFWIFDDSVNVAGNKKICNLPSTTQLSRHILEDSIIDIIRVFSLNHKECAFILLNTEQYFNTSYIEQNGIQVYEAVVEAIFQEMFRLPKCHERFVYYSTLIIDLCKESLDKIPSVLGRSIKLLFSRLDSENGTGGMDVECIKRFSDFFARHLSNFGYSWKWSEWEYVLDADPTCGKFVFVRETLQNCVRLAYYDRIKNSIPENFELQGQIFASSAPSFLFSFQESDIVADDNLFDLVRELNSKISHRDDTNLIEEVLNSIDKYIAQSSGNFSERFIGKTSYENAHEAFLQCIMYQGSKSFSHLLGVVERYLPLLQKINEDEQRQLLTTRVTHAFWENNPQFLEIILTKLVNYKIIEARAIITWLLSPENLEKNCTRFFVWNILSTTLNKLTVRVEQITIRLEKQKNQADDMMNDDMQESAASLEAALEAAQKERKDTFILCMQVVQVLIKKFVEILTSITPEDAVYWRWVSGFFRQMTREFQVEIDKLKFTLDALVFGSVTDEHLRNEDADHSTSYSCCCCIGQKNAAGNYSSILHLFNSWTVLCYCMIIKLINRWQVDIYAPRKMLSRGRPPSLSHGILSWIATVYSTPETFVINTVGLDGVIFLRFLKMGYQLFFILTIFGASIIAPINFYSNPPDLHNITGYYKLEAILIPTFSIENVPQRSVFLKLLLGCTWVISFVAFGFLIFFYRGYLTLKLQYDEYALKRTKLSKIEMRSVMVFGIPKELRNEVNLSVFFNNLQIGKVENVVLCRNWSLLQQAVQKRLYYLEKLEKLCLKLDSLPKLERSFVIPEATAFRNSQMSAVDVAIEEIMNKYNSIEPEYRPTHKTGLFGLFGERVDSTQNYVANFRHWDSMVERFRRNPHLSAATSIGIVSFESPISAAIASQAVSHMDPFACIVKNAPEPRDIYWQNLSSKAAHSYTKLFRMVFVMTVMSLLIPFSAGVISSIAGLIDLDQLAILLPFLKPILTDLPDTWIQFIQGVIPTTLIAAWNACLPSLLLVLPAQLLLAAPLFLTWMYRLATLQKSTPRQTSDAYYPSILTVIHYGIVYPVPILVLNKLTSIQPLILPFCMLFFAIGYFIYKYLLLYVHIPFYESKGVATPYVVNRCLSGIAIMQLSMMGVLALKSAEDGSLTVSSNLGSADSLSAYAQMVIGVMPLLFITYFVYKLLNDAYEKQIRNIPLEVIGRAMRSLVKESEDNIATNESSSSHLSQPSLLFEQELAGFDNRNSRKLKNRLSSLSMKNRHNQDQIHINISDDSSSGDEVIPNKRYSTFNIIQPNPEFNPFHDPSEVNPILDITANSGYQPITANVDIMNRHIEPPMTRVAGVLDVPLESAMLKYGEESDNISVDDVEEDCQLHSYMHPALIGKLPLPWIEGNSFEALRKDQGKQQKALLQRLKYQQRLSIEEADPDIEATERNLLGRVNGFFDGITSWLNLAVS
ncbi:Nuclear cap-binding protein subunit 1 [Boothiomyces sp. JEL0866]|nr:Nuclear cap-binding protein subunit 1 [Boothiomyces sp. JEL0866]